MVLFMLGAAAALAGGAPAAAGEVRLRMWTVGHQVGTRTSTELCRWSAEVRADGGYHKVQGRRVGNCRHVRALVEQERAAKLADLQARLGRVDRP